MELTKSGFGGLSRADERVGERSESVWKEKVPPSPPKERRRKFGWTEQIMMMTQSDYCSTALIPTVLAWTFDVVSVAEKFLLFVNLNTSQHAMFTVYSMCFLFWGTDEILIIHLGWRMNSRDFPWFIWKQPKFTSVDFRPFSQLLHIISTSQRDNQPGLE